MLPLPILIVDQPKCFIIVMHEVHVTHVIIIIQNQERVKLKCVRGICKRGRRPALTWIWLSIDIFIILQLTLGM